MCERADSGSASDLISMLTLTSPSSDMSYRRPAAASRPHLLGPAEQIGGGGGVLIRRASPPAAVSDLRVERRVELGQVKEEGTGTDRRGGGNKDGGNDAETAASPIGASS